MHNICVFKCNNNKFYVKDVPRDVPDTIEYMKSLNTSFLSKNSPIETCEIYETNDGGEEDVITKKYMQIYGIDNVRGGSYTTDNIEDNQKDILINEFNLDNKQIIDNMFTHNLFDKYDSLVNIRSLINANLTNLALRLSDDKISNKLLKRNIDSQQNIAHLFITDINEKYETEDIVDAFMLKYEKIIDG